VILAIVVSQLLSSDNLNYANRGIPYSIIMLSLVAQPVTEAKVSLCQLPSPVSGLRMSKVGVRGSTWAAGGSRPVRRGGTLVPCPPSGCGASTWRWHPGLCVGMDTVFFTSTSFFGTSTPQRGPPPHPGISFNSNRTYFVGLCIVFIVAGSDCCLRRSAFGRRLLAISDSPAACLTLGVT